MKKNKITTIIMIVFFAGFFLFCLLKPTEEFSVAERRPLKGFPEATWNSLRSGRFMKEFEDAALDQFPARDEFRKVKAFIEKHLLRKKNNNDIYVKNDYAVDMVYPVNEISTANAVKVMKGIYEKYLKENDMKVYFSMIPDKHYFLAKEADQLSIDYEAFMNSFIEELSFAKYIEIRDTLSIEDYYRTDSHWRQECIVETAQRLNQEMGSSVTGKYNQNTLERPFNGVYSGQWALSLKEDELTYLTNDVIDQYVVYDYENGKEIPVYDLDKAAGHDMYETYLGGPLSLITIENPEINNQKELILFRDSFGSSIAPLLAEGYKKVTLVDIRYLRYERLEQFINFENQDVLFLYSTGLLNNNEIR